MTEGAAPRAGMSWADCLAALQAGERPASFLASGSEPLHPPQELPPLEVPATAHLYQQVDGPAPRTFQLVYLRPPFTLWDYIESGDASKGGLDVSDVFDNELDLDVIGMFHPRFVDAPDFLLGETRDAGLEADTRDEAGLEEEGPVIPRDDQDRGDELDSGFFSTGRRRRPPVSRYEERHREAEVDLVELTGSVAEYLSRSLQNDVEVSLPDSVQRLSRFEWSLLYSRLKERMVLHPSDVVRLLRAVHTLALAEMILLTAFEDVIATDGHSEAEAAAVEDLARVAARCCIEGGWTSSRLREYIDAGLLSAGGVHASSALLTVCLSFSDLL